MANDSKLDQDPTLSLPERQKLHVTFMRSIAISFRNTPLILKGGTALLLAYGLDRYSEDLDFDSRKKIKLETKIKNAVKRVAKIKSIDHIKDTDTTTRYRVIYIANEIENRLKIEVSYREYDAAYHFVNNIKVYELPILFEQKLNAIENRTAARDLYDLCFLIKNHFDKLNQNLLFRARSIFSNLSSLEQRFSPAFEVDSILSSVDIIKILSTTRDSLG
jgi:predicted nucleotidyltransferase component of viral defense system